MFRLEEAAVHQLRIEALGCLVRFVRRAPDLVLVGQRHGASLRAAKIDPWKRASQRWSSPHTTSSFRTAPRRSPASRCYGSGASARRPCEPWRHLCPSAKELLRGSLISDAWREAIQSSLRAPATTSSASRAGDRKSTRLNS